MQVRRISLAMSFAGLALILTMAGCHKNNAAAAQQPASDPAQANLAYASTGTANPPAPPADTSASDDEQAQAQQYPAAENYAPEDDTADEQPEYASEAPPPLPEYTQPECPGDNYMWTPGYWAWGPDGYYWVPGAWVLAPFYGALWTPGYWAFVVNRYEWYPGYWGPHVGYYGGINYGHGYWGNGYEGGYWRQDHFYYNSYVTRVNADVAHNYGYNYRVENHYNTSRVAYNGGRGGVNFRPTQEQEAAQRESHYGALPSQRQSMQAARNNRNQYAQVNHGRPTTFAEQRGVAGGRKAPSRPPSNLHAMPGYNHAGTNPAVERGRQQRNPQPNRQENRTPQQREQHTQPSRPAAGTANHENYRQPPRQAVRPGNQVNHEQNRPQPQQNRQPERQNQPQQRTEPQQRAQQRPQSQPQRRAEPQRPQQQRPQSHAQSQRQARPQPHNEHSQPQKRDDNGHPH